MTTTKLDPFTRAYAEAALWSSTGDDGEPLDSTHDLDSIAPETLERMISDCAKFQADNAADIASGCSRSCGYSDAEMAGHDFWLTRCGHGAGFWDGDWQDEAGERLTAACKAFGNVDLYVGDDGLIYC